MAVFSIVTACLDAASTIESAIKSVLAQGWSGLEYIVIDGGSADGTLEVIEKYRPRLAHVVSESDGGIYDAFNKGVALATGDLVGILNADDQYAPWAFSAVAKAEAAYPDYGVFYGKMAVIDKARRRWTVYPLGDSARLTEGMGVPHPAVFVRRALYEKHGLFDTSFKVAGDWDFMLRLHLAGERFHPIDKVLAAFANTGVSSQVSGRLAAENRRVCFKRLKFSSATRNVVKMELRRLGRKVLELLGVYQAYGRYRDAKILRAEASGAYGSSLDEVWAALGG
ncbi:MAG: glycosyltransferase [Synergistaceae bacterium]|jgi:glycosyltransferase involved in cell wall biosynthesis|nr:glycosyltransferase [Synergistaceae bacterium]